jgi:hypothetical protein
MRTGHVMFNTNSIEEGVERLIFSTPISPQEIENYENTGKLRTCDAAYKSKQIYCDHR